MLFVFGILTYVFFIISIVIFISAILSSGGASDSAGRSHVNNLLITSMVFMGLYLIGSLGVILMAIIKSVRKAGKDDPAMRRVGTEPIISALITGTP